jgi:hypothetical protein
VAIVNEIAGFRRTGTVDWGHVALIVGVPASIYAIVATMVGLRVALGFKS